MLDLPTDKPEIVAQGLHGARRLRRRADARSRADRQGARRRHRGVARPARRRLAHPRQAAPGPLLPVALRRAAADRQARDPADRAGRAAARVLRHVVSPGSDGDRRRRRHRCRSRSRQAIRTTFGPLEARAPRPRRRRTDRCRCTRRLLVNVATDPEVTQSSVSAGAQAAGASGSDRVGDYRRTLVERLFAQMLNERFSELARKPDAKFLGAGAGGGGLSPTVETFSLSARVPDGKIADGLDGARRSRRGASASSASPRPSSIARSSGWPRSTSAPTPSATRARAARSPQEYLGHFLEGEPSAGIEYEYRLVQQRAARHHARRK